MAKLKADPKKIVFTEGTDERILEASSRLLQDGYLTPVLVGKVEEVKTKTEAAVTSIKKKLQTLNDGLGDEFNIFG